MPKSPVSKRTREAVENTIRRARAGDAAARWAHLAILRAGYAPVTQTGDEPILVVAAQLARVVGVSDRTVRRWIREGCPCYRQPTGNQAALYDLAAVLRWRAEREEAADHRALPAAERKEVYLAEVRREQAIKLRRENRLRRGELVERALLTDALSGVARALRSRVETIAAACGQEAARLYAEALDEADAALDATLTPAESPEEVEEPDDRAQEEVRPKAAAAKPRRPRRRPAAARRTRPHRATDAGAVQPADD